MQTMTTYRRAVRDTVGKLLGAQNDLTLVWATNLPIIYVNNPKCGCSTIKRSLRSAQISLPHIAEQPAVAGPHEADHLLKHKGLPPRASRGRFVISCVRNPFTRALSGYLDKIHGREFDEYRVLHKRPVRDFEDHLQALTGYVPQKMEPHLRPQHLNLNFPDLRYDALFYLEDLQPFQRFLTRFAPDFVIESFRAHATDASSKLRQFYTPRALDLVRDIYREDFKLFGYGQSLDNVSTAPGEVIVGDTPVADVSSALKARLAKPRERGRFNALERTLYCHRLAEMKII